MVNESILWTTYMSIRRQARNQIRITNLLVYYLYDDLSTGTVIGYLAHHDPG